MLHRAHWHKIRIYLIFFTISMYGTGCQKPDTPVHEDLNIANPVLDFRPNILWIVAEDLSPNIPSFGDSTISTPALSRLAEEGVCYDQFYAPHPVCAPARAALITGMYANSIGASHMRTGPWFMDSLPQIFFQRYADALPEGLIPYEAVPPVHVRMFTEYLRHEGYYCTNNSKLDYQFKKTATAWDESSNSAHWRNRPKGKPFFSVFNLFVTHESQIWAKANDSLWVDPDLDVPVPPYLPDTDIAIQDIRRMYSNVKEMDHQVGRILEELEADGLLDSTIIVWYTDHGGPLPRQKRLLYDSGMKVPMIIRFPDNQFAGHRDNRMISFIDMGPTALSLAGIQPPDNINGSAFLGPFIRSIEPKYVFGAADRFDEVSDHARSVRDKRFKYIKYYQPEKSMYLDVTYRKQMPIMQELLRLKEANMLTPAQALWFRSQKPDEELFDLEKDPFEINNIANDPTFTDKLSELRKQCNQWVASIDDTGLIPETSLIEKMWPGKEQPLTADPIFSLDGDRLRISSSTPGASIGYNIIFAGNNPTGDQWKVYTGPIVVTADTKILAIAHRIGYKRSKALSWTAEDGL